VTEQKKKKFNHPVGLIQGPRNTLPRAGRVLPRPGKVALNQPVRLVITELLLKALNRLQDRAFPTPPEQVEGCLLLQAHIRKFLR